MKRHPSLEPFSRDHNVGLILARQLIQASKGSDQVRRQAAQVLSQYWKEELEDHFGEEEVLLTPLIPREELRAQLVEEHRVLARFVALADGGSFERAVLAKTGRLLSDHVRWEERVLFPSIELTATVSQLVNLARETTLLENRRSNSSWSPRRGELMRRRDERFPDRAAKPDRLYDRAINRWESEGGRVA